MKQLKTFLILIACMSCKQEKPVVVSKKQPASVDSITVNKNGSPKSYSFDTTFIANKQTFKFCIESISSNQVKLTFTRNSKTIKTDTLSSEGLGRFKFTDFNNDGNPDIVFAYMGNKFSYGIYLFDKLNNEFRDVDGFERFPEAVQLKANPKYYYSYHRAGCADMNWASDLFYIDNFKTIHVGHIYAQGCDFRVEENPQFIDTYKISGNNPDNKKLVERLPYDDGGDKWEFIEKYWNRNFKKFN